MPSENPGIFTKNANATTYISIIVGCLATALCSSSFLVTPSPLATLLVIILTAVITVFSYKLFNENERQLNRRLKRIRPDSHLLTQQPAGTPRRPIRIWIDGCYDLCHIGHFNAFRQAKALGDVLVVGINTDADIRKFKGPPIMSDDERFAAVRGCKWVDEIVADAPYVMDEAFLNTLFTKYNIDYVVHGDDPCLLPDGSDVFASAKKAGKYRSIKRTEGVSTTDIVGRMLVLTKEHHIRNSQGSLESPTQVADLFARPSSPTLVANSQNNNNNTDNLATTTSAGEDDDDDNDDDDDDNDDEDSHPIRRTSESRKAAKEALHYIMQDRGATHAAFSRTTTFMPTSRRLNQFSAGNRKPKPNDRIVYVDGTWDLFNAAHIDFLEQCHKHGDFLIVGVYPDDVANTLHGSNFPILNLHERVLSVLSCKWADDVIFGCPYNVTRDFITTFNISVVCHGSISDRVFSLKRLHLDASYDQQYDPYVFPRAENMLVEIKSPRDMTTTSLIERILAQRDQFEDKFARKNASEEAYTAQKEFVEEL